MLGAEVCQLDSVSAMLLTAVIGTDEKTCCCEVGEFSRSKIVKGLRTCTGVDQAIGRCGKTPENGTALATTAKWTVFTPAASKIREISFAVAPVVMTSSTSRTREPANFPHLPQA